MQKANKTQRVKGKFVSWRLLLALVVIVSLGVAISTYLRQDKEFKRLILEAEELKLQLDNALRENKEIQELNALVGSSEYIERVARDQLGLVRPDEIIFIHR